MLNTGGDHISVLRDGVSLPKALASSTELARALVDLGAGPRRASAATPAIRSGRGTNWHATAAPSRSPRQRGTSSPPVASGCAASGAQSLTPSERRIAQMVVDGGSNAEIA